MSRGSLVATGVERLLDQRGIADLDEIFRAEREVALPAAQVARRRRRDRHQAVELFAKRIFVPGDGVEEGGIILQHGAAELVLRRALLAPDPFEHAPNGVLIKSLDGVFGGVADADHVDHGLDLRERLCRCGHRAVDGAEALPEPEDMAEIVEMAFAGAIEEAAEILEGIDDVPFGEGEEGVVQFAPVARLVDRGQGHRRRTGRCGAGRGAARPLDIGQRHEHRQRDQDRDDSQDAPQPFKHERRSASAAPAHSRSGSPRRRGRDAGRWRKTASRAAG